MGSWNNAAHRAAAKEKKEKRTQVESDTCWVLHYVYFDCLTFARSLGSALFTSGVRLSQCLDHESRANTQAAPAELEHSFSALIQGRQQE